MKHRGTLRTAAKVWNYFQILGEVIWLLYSLKRWCVVFSFYTIFIVDLDELVDCYSYRFGITRFGVDRCDICEKGNVCPNLEPQGTTAEIDWRSEILSFILTENFLFDKKNCLILNKYFSAFIVFSLNNRPLCHILSKALETSINTAPVWQCFSNEVLICSVIRKSCWTVKWLDLNPNWNFI